MEKVGMAQAPQRGFGRGAWRIVACCLPVLLVACGTAPSVAERDNNDVQQADAPSMPPVPCAWRQTVASAAEPPLQWKHLRFPGKRPNDYRFERLDGREALRVQATSSTSMLRKDVRIAPEQLHNLQFSWKVPALIPTADMTVGERSDSPVRLVLAFDGDRSKFSARDAMLSELANALTGEPMPYATLMYVWDNHQAVGTVLHNKRTGRIRKLVLESGPAHVGQWRDYLRDVRADFRAAFGEEPGALLGIGIMTDTDNTRSRAQAWYGPVRHLDRGVVEASMVPVRLAGASCPG